MSEDNIPPFQRFHDKNKQKIIDEMNGASKIQQLQEILNQWSKLPESEKIIYNFEDFDSMTCSMSDNGAVLIRQPWFHCETCWPNQNQKGCCLACAKRCHAGHNVAYQGWCFSYCDCALSGKCNQYHREKQIINQPNLVQMRMNNVEHLGEPQIHVPTGNVGKQIFIKDENGNEAPLQIPKLSGISGIHSPTLSAQQPIIKDFDVFVKRLWLRSQQTFVHPIFAPQHGNDENQEEEQ